MHEQPQTGRKLLFGYVIDVAAPFLAYVIFHALGVSALWALLISVVPAIVSLSVNTARQKHLDSLGILVLFEIGVSIALLFYTRDARFLLIKPSFYSGAAGVYLIYSSFTQQPLSYIGAKPMATKGDPTRENAYEQTWQNSADFRLSHKRLTFGWGLASLADAALRIFVVYELPADRALWAAHLPHVAAIVIMLAVSAVQGRKSKDLVESELKRLNTSIDLKSGSQRLDVSGS